MLFATSIQQLFSTIVDRLPTYQWDRINFRPFGRQNVTTRYRDITRSSR